MNKTKRHYPNVGSFELFRCKSCGQSLQELIDTVPQEEVMSEMIAHANGKCKPIEKNNDE